MQVKAGIFLNYPGQPSLASTISHTTRRAEPYARYESTYHYDSKNVYETRRTTAKHSTAQAARSVDHHTTTRTPFQAKNNKIIKITTNNASCCAHSRLTGFCTYIFILIVVLYDRCATAAGLVLYPPTPTHTRPPTPTPPHISPNAPFIKIVHVEY